MAGSKRRGARIAVGAAVLVAVSSSSTRTRASDPSPPQVELRGDLRVDVPVTATLGAGIVTWALVRNEVLARSCRICDGPEVNAVDAFFRDALKRPDGAPAKTISNVLSYGVAPVGLAALSVLAAEDHGALRDVPTDLVYVAEGTLAALAVSESLKPLTMRERPDYHALRTPEERAAYPADGEPLLSFPSGHGGTIMALTGAAGTIAMMRGYRLAPLIWLTGSILGVTTGYLRIAADRHYFTDVVAGWTISGLVGAGVPYLFHRPRASAAPTLGSVTVPGGRLVTATWAF